MMSVRGEVYTEYRMGPSTEPWDSSSMSARFRSLWTGSSWIDKTVSLHPKAFPVIPKRCSSLVMRMSWSTVSNAAGRPSNTNITHCPSSMARRMLLCIRVSAVSVLWPFLYADWKISRRLASSRWWLRRTATNFSLALEMKHRFEIGLKFFYTSWSRPGI